MDQLKKYFTTISIDYSNTDQLKSYLTTVSIDYSNMDQLKNYLTTVPIPQQIQYLPLLTYLGFNLYLGLKLWPTVTRYNTQAGRGMLLYALGALAFTWFYMVSIS